MNIDNSIHHIQLFQKQIKEEEKEIETLKQIIKEHRKNIRNLNKEIDFIRE